MDAINLHEKLANLAAESCAPHSIEAEPVIKCTVSRTLFLQKVFGIETAKQVGLPDVQETVDIEVDQDGGYDLEFRNKEQAIYAAIRVNKLGVIESLLFLTTSQCPSARPNMITAGITKIYSDCQAFFYTTVTTGKEGRVRGLPASCVERHIAWAVVANVEHPEEEITLVDLVRSIATSKPGGLLLISS